MKQSCKIIVSAIVLNDQDEVLLGKRSMDEEVFPGLWGIPGGRVEATATGRNIIEETLRREAREEMGIEIEPERYLESSCRVTDNEIKIYLIFTARHVGGTPQALEDTEEVRWWKLSDLREEDLTPHTYHNILRAISERQ